LRDIHVVMWTLSAATTRGGSFGEVEWRSCILGFFFLGPSSLLLHTVSWHKDHVLV
jgi:hypothetical protein